MKRIILILSIFISLIGYSQVGVNPVNVWNISGNTFTSSINWLGTKNAQNLVFKTNNSTVATFSTSGKAMFNFAIQTPTIYGGSTTASTLNLFGSSSATPGVINVGEASEKVFISNQKVYNVLNYGLVGDGVTDDRTALNTLLNTTAPSGSTIYFPPKTYLINSNISISDKQFNIVSDFAVITTTANVALLTISSTSSITSLAAKWKFSNINFTGNATGNIQTAINFNLYSGKFSITNCTFNSFGASGVGSAITVSSTQFTNNLGGDIANCKFYSNFIGAYLNTRSEYIKITGCDFTSNTTPIYMVSGNNIISNNNITYNLNGIYAFNGSNNGHSIITGNNLNHNNNYTLWIESTPYGMTISDNHIYTGFIKFKNSTGINISGGIIDVNNYEFDGNIGCTFNNVTFDSSYVNSTTLTNGVLPIYTNCKKMNGSAATNPNTFIQSNRAAGATVLTNTATLDFPSTSAGAVSDLTLTVTGAINGDGVFIGVPNGSMPVVGSFSGWVSATNIVTIRYINNALVTAYNPASGVFKAIVNKN